MKKVVPIDAVTDAYRGGLAWQYRRTQLLNDKLEKRLDELHELKVELRQICKILEEGAVFILNAQSHALFQKALTEMVEEDRAKSKRQKELRPGGFDARKVFPE